MTNFLQKKKYTRIFANLQLAEKSIALETEKHPSLQAIYLNIARSARPQRNFDVPDVTNFNIFMNFRHFGLMAQSLTPLKLFTTNFLEALVLRI